MIRRNLGCDSFCITRNIYRTEIQANQLAKTFFTDSGAKWALFSYNSCDYFHCPLQTDTDWVPSMPPSPHCMSREKKVTGSVYPLAPSGFDQIGPILKWQKSIMIPRKPFQCLSTYSVLKNSDLFQLWAFSTVFSTWLRRKSTVRHILPHLPSKHSWCLKP